MFHEHSFGYATKQEINGKIFDVSSCSCGARCFENLENQIIVEPFEDAEKVVKLTEKTKVEVTLNHLYNHMDNLISKMHNYEALGYTDKAEKICLIVEGILQALDCLGLYGINRDKHNWYDDIIYEHVKEAI